MNEANIGELNPQETVEALKNDPNAVLIDVRTLNEWQQIGRPKLPDGLKNHVLFIEWVDSRAQPNPNFLVELKSACKDVDRPLYFICRSGGRSRAAAAAAQYYGYRHCFNVAEGVEGDMDNTGLRCQISGWIYRGLPIDGGAMADQS